MRLNALLSRVPDWIRAWVSLDVTPQEAVGYRVPRQELRRRIAQCNTVLPQNVNRTAMKKDKQQVDAELRILARLGASLLEQWDAASPPVQKSVIHRARTLGGPGDHARGKESLARFLGAHRGES